MLCSINLEILNFQYFCVSATPTFPIRWSIKCPSGIVMVVAACLCNFSSLRTLPPCPCLSCPPLPMEGFVSPVPARLFRICLARVPRKGSSGRFSALEMQEIDAVESVESRLSFLLQNPQTPEVRVSEGFSEGVSEGFLKGSWRGQPKDPSKRCQEPFENLSRRCRNRWCVGLPGAYK